VSKKETENVIKSYVSTIQGEFGEEIILKSVAFFHKLPTDKAKMGYIDHLLKLALKHPAHLARVFFIVMMINVSLEV